MRVLRALATGLTAWSRRWIPSAFSIACILTFLTFALAFVVAGAPATTIVQQWGSGFWTLLPFAMQMCLVILTGYIVSTAPVVERMLAWLAGRSRSPRSAVAMMALVSMGLAWIHWGLSIVASAMLVRHMARQQRHVDYRLLVAVAYFGLGATWHSGLSASAPLLVATPGHFLETQIGIVPVARTIFHPFNLVLTVAVAVLLTLLAVLLHPDAQHTMRVDPTLIESLGRFRPPVRPSERTVANWLDHSPLLNFLVALAGLGWLTWHIRNAGFVLTLDVLNFVFLMLAVALHRTPASLLAAADQGAGLLAGIVVQFPFYAGMHGVIAGTGLASAAGRWIASIATADTFPLLTYWYSGVVNYFVPSGGAKWAIEAPYMIDAARRLGVGVDQTVVAYAWGDMATDLIQPFWALPLLAAARLDFRDIVGYEMVVFLVYAVFVSVAFALMPAWW